MSYQAYLMKQTYGIFAIWANISNKIRLNKIPTFA
jgi:hypothetical protein